MFYERAIVTCIPLILCLNCLLKHKIKQSEPIYTLKSLRSPRESNKVGTDSETGTGPSRNCKAGNIHI